MLFVSRWWGRRRPSSPRQVRRNPFLATIAFVIGWFGILVAWSALVAAALVHGAWLAFTVALAVGATTLAALAQTLTMRQVLKMAAPDAMEAYELCGRARDLRRRIGS